MDVAWQMMNVLFLSLSQMFWCYKNIWASLFLIKKCHDCHFWCTLLQWGLYFYMYANTF